MVVVRYRCGSDELKGGRTADWAERRQGRFAAIPLLQQPCRCTHNSSTATGASLNWLSEGRVTAAANRRGDDARRAADSRSAGVSPPSPLGDDRLVAGHHQGGVASSFQCISLVIALASTRDEREELGGGRGVAVSARIAAAHAFASAPSALTPQISFFSPQHIHLASPIVLPPSLSP